LPALFCLTALLYAQNSPDTLMKAMKDELERSKTLEISSLDKPYFIEYTVEDMRSFAVSASLGGIMTRNSNHARVPRTRVRVGDYAFDNGNYVFSDLGVGGAELPLDDNYSVLRRGFWLATDRAFKSGVEAIARKRSALKNITQNETLPDLWKAPALQKLVPPRPNKVSQDAWTERIRNLSALFRGYPEVLSSTVNFEASDATFYLTNSEGAVLRSPDSLSTIQIRASGQASDGMTVRDAAIIPAMDEKALPSEAELRKTTAEVAQRIKDLTKAPVGEAYSGPVLFEGMAGPQIIAEVLAPHLALPRRPVAEPGRPAPFLPSEFEGRIDARVLPEFLDVVDDPTQKAWNGSQLLGFYEFDYEGVVPAPLTVIEKGRLKTFLLSRQPVKGFNASNGRARVPGAYGANAAAATNLFVRSSEAVTPESLRGRLLKMIADRNKPYGIIVRRMDFPTTASQSDLRRIFMASAQGGSARPISSPVHVYRIYPNGKEELIRGMRFRGLNVRALRDIVAVSNDSVVFHYLNSLAPMSMQGTGYVAPTSVVAPSLLFEDLELERPQDETPTLPVVPPPPLTASR
jgi:predicted Zn-dependent protease